MDYIIDTQCTDNICSGPKSYPLEYNVTLNHFYEQHDKSYNYLFISLIILLIQLYNIYYFNNIYDNKNIKLCFYENIITIFLILIMIFHYYITKTENLCYYDYECQVINNTLQSSKYWYKLTNTECPNNIMDITEMFNDYYGNYNKPNTMKTNCGNSKYGCCLINNQCSFATKYNNGVFIYNHYIEYNMGYFSTSIWKNDDEGTNCINILDMIILNTKGCDKNNFNLFILLILLRIVYIIFFNIYICYLKLNYKFNNIELSEDKEEDETNENSSILKSSV